MRSHSRRVTIATGVTTPSQPQGPNRGGFCSSHPPKDGLQARLVKTVNILRWMAIRAGQDRRFLSLNLRKRIVETLRLQIAEEKEGFLQCLKVMSLPMVVVGVDTYHGDRIPPSSVCHRHNLAAWGRPSLGDLVCVDARKY